MWGFAESETSRAFLAVERSASGRAWRARLDGAGERTAASIAQRTGVPELLARVLAGRGIVPESAEAFLAPSLKSDLPDPSLLAGMDIAAERLADAVARQEQVAIFGDYDVDGATSAALLWDVLSAFGLKPRIYIPDRIFEGYGPNPQAITTLVEDGARLIICVDCGSTSFEALAQARSLGADVVVLDHHQLGTSVPDALALVNPNRHDDVSGLNNLAAVGVVFFAAVALLRTLRRRGWPAESMPDLRKALDLVALGTVCDMVPLSGVNRALVVKGLVALRHSDRVGLRALIRASRLRSAPDCGHLGFLLGPRINAGGRIGDASLGARLLTTSDEAEAIRIADLLDRLNQERQAIEAECVADAVAEAEAEIGVGNGPDVLLVSRPGWHPGVVGLVASRLKERFERPAVAVAIDDTGLGSGSGRSIAGVDLGSAIRAAVAKGILVKGGGHAMAAGLTIRVEELGSLRAFLETELGSAVHAASGESVLDIDGAISAGGATAGAIAEVERAGPFGTGNPAPVFAIPAHRVASADLVGNGHVRVTLAAPSGAKLKGIAYRAAASPLGRFLLGSRGRVLHVAGILCLDHWNGSARPQIRIQDAAEAAGHA